MRHPRTGGALPAVLARSAVAPQILLSAAILLIITTNGPLYKGQDALVVGRLRLGMLAGLFGFLVSVLM